MSQTNPAVANHLKQCNARLIEIGTKKDDVFEPSMAILQDLQKGFSKLRVVYDYERNLEYGIVPSSGKPPVALGRDNRFVSVVLDTVWNYFIKGFTNIIPIVNYASDNAELYLMITYYYARFRVVETLNLMLDNKNSDLLKLVNEDDIKYLTGLGYTYDPWLMPIKQIHLSNVSDNIRKDQEISTRKKMGQYIANMNRMGLKIEALSNDFSLVFFDHSVSYDSDFQSQF